jgi:hypothetical protein
MKVSIVNYLGCNFTLPISDDDSEDEVLVNECFPNTEMKQILKKHLSTIQVYEILGKGHVGIWFNDDYKMRHPRSNIDSQESFLALCRLLDSYLKEGDYCEFYVCWAGDEEEDRDAELDQTINLNNFNINDIQIYEKTLLVIRK